MKNIQLALFISCFVASSAYAGQIDPNAPAVNWRKASSGERLTYTKRAAVACLSSNCGPIEIKACMDEVVRPPAPAAVENMTIGEVAVGCISTLRSQ